MFTDEVTRFTGEFESIRTYARVTDAFTTEAAGEAIAVTVSSPNFPVTGVFEAVYSEIPIYQAHPADRPHLQDPEGRLRRDPTELS